MVVLRKLHPHGGDRCDRKRCQVRACAGAQKRDLARSRMTMTCPLPGSVDGWLGVEDETGPCNGVKGAVDACDPPLEARVPRLDRCCLKQKVGYSRDTAPKNNYRKNRTNHSCHTKRLKHTPLFRRDDLLSGSDSGRVSRIRAQSGLRCRGETCRFFTVPRTILGESFLPIPESRSGQIMDDFMEPEVSIQPLMRREGRSLRPPIFQKTFL